MALSGFSFFPVSANLIFIHRPFVGFEIFGKKMGSIALGHKIKVFNIRRGKCCVDAAHSWVGDWGRRQAPHFICIIRCFGAQVYPFQIAVEIVDSVNHGGIAGEAHFDFQPVMKYSGNQRTFMAGPGFLFDD